MPKFVLNQLPFKPSDFKNLSPESFEYHHGKHHQSYVTNLNTFFEDSKISERYSEDLSEIIKKSHANLSNEIDRKIFNNAAQIYNHDFFWNSLDPKKTTISPEIAKLLEKSFGSIENFVDEFHKSAVALFGSGWVWIVYNQALEKLEIMQTSNAFTPITESAVVPLLVCDVWEHAYYIDYRNRRVDFVKEIAEHFNWAFAQKNFESIK